MNQRPCHIKCVSATILPDILCGYRFPVLLLLILLSCQLYAQKSAPPDSLLKKIGNYKEVSAYGFLFAHFDKTIYTNNEDVWFTAFLLKADLSKQVSETVSAALVNDMSHQVIMDETFLLADRLAFGHFIIPDTLPPGSYHVLVHCNSPDLGAVRYNFFSQPITIKRAAAQTLTASIKFLGDSTSKDGAAGLKALVYVSDKTKPAPVTAVISYNLFGKAYQLKNQPNGDALIDIPANAAGKLLKISVSANKEVVYLTIKVPAGKAGRTVKFYPEGGSLTAGVSNLTGWEAMSSTGEPLQVRGILYENSIPIDTIQTTGYGIGKFILTPKSNARYYVKLQPAKDEQAAKEIVYNLPPILSGRPSMHVMNRLAEDTLVLQIGSKEARNVLLLVHNREQVIAYQPLLLNKLKNQVKVLLTDAPPGIATVTILDTLGRPLSECLFFAHYRHRAMLSVSTDKTTYRTGENVHLRIGLKDRQARPAKGMVSIACVQDNRIESRQPDILSYVNLRHALDNIPRDPSGLNYNNADYVNDLLLVKGWRRYLWADTAGITPNTKSNYKGLLTGKITKGGKPPKQPMVVTVFNQGNINPLATDKDGKFVVPDPALVVAPGNKVTLMAAGKNPEDYSISVNYLPLKTDSSLSALPPLDPVKTLNELSSDVQLLKGLDQTFALKEVTIKGESDQTIYGAAHKGEVGYCTDYVCENNILNCKVHAASGNNRPPVAGVTYHTNHGDKVYRGCVLFVATGKANPYQLALKGINMRKEYHSPDLAEMNSPDFGYRSTIYWNYNVNLSTQNDADLSFYAGNISGKFRIVVQGVTENDLLFNEQYFEIEKKDSALPRQAQ